MSNLWRFFPNASKSILERNHHLFDKPPQADQKNPVQVKVERGKGHSMNRTEAEYALILEAMKRRGDILRYEYEGITLRWAEIRYTPDFVVILTSERWKGKSRPFHLVEIKFIEVKGGFIGGKFERAVERFRHARTYWPEFQFEMMQKKKGIWTRIH